MGKMDLCRRQLPQNPCQRGVHLLSMRAGHETRAIVLRTFQTCRSRQGRRCFAEVVPGTDDGDLFGLYGGQPQPLFAVPTCAHRGGVADTENGVPGRLPSRVSLAVAFVYMARSASTCYARRAPQERAPSAPQADVISQRSGVSSARSVLPANDRPGQCDRGVVCASRRQ
jgi:hypothetical protein